MRMATCHPDRKHHAKGLCKGCYYAAWNPAYHAAHKEADNARSRAYHAAHKDAANARSRAYYTTHKKDRRAYFVAYYRARTKIPQGGE